MSYIINEILKITCFRNPLLLVLHVKLISCLTETTNELSHIQSSRRECQFLMSDRHVSQPMTEPENNIWGCLTERKNEGKCQKNGFSSVTIKI